MAVIHRSNEPADLEPLVSSTREAESLKAIGGLNSP